MITVVRGDKGDDVSGPAQSRQDGGLSPQAVIVACRQHWNSLPQDFIVEHSACGGSRVYEPQLRNRRQRPVLPGPAGQAEKKEAKYRENAHAGILWAGIGARARSEW